MVGHGFLRSWLSRSGATVGLTRARTRSRRSSDAGIPRRGGAGPYPRSTVRVRWGALRAGATASVGLAACSCSAAYAPTVAPPTAATTAAPTVVSPAAPAVISATAVRPRIPLQAAPIAPAAPAGPSDPTRGRPSRRPAPRPTDAPPTSSAPAGRRVHHRRRRRSPRPHLGDRSGPGLRRRRGLRLLADAPQGAAHRVGRRRRHLPPRDARGAARRAGRRELPGLRRAGRDHRRDRERRLRPVLAGLEPRHGQGRRGCRRHTRRVRLRRPRSRRDGPHARGGRSDAVHRRWHDRRPPLLHVQLQRPAAAEGSAVARRTSSTRPASSPKPVRPARTAPASWWCRCTGASKAPVRWHRASGGGRRRSRPAAPSTSSSATMPTSSSRSNRSTAGGWCSGSATS